MRSVAILNTLFIWASLACIAAAAVDATDSATDKEILDRPAREVGDFPGKDQVKIGEREQNASSKAEMRHEAVENLKTRGLRSLNVGAYLDAIKLLEAAVRVEPDNIECLRALCDAHVQYGDHLREQQQIKEAVEEYRKALSANESCKEAQQRIQELSDGHQF
jgi:tetratricopeptide (TPR) repeat protein